MCQIGIKAQGIMGTWKNEQKGNNERLIKVQPNPEATYLSYYIVKQQQRQIYP